MTKHKPKRPPAPITPQPKPTNGAHAIEQAQSDAVMPRPMDAQLHARMIAEQDIAEIRRLSAALGERIGTSGLNAFSGYVAEAYTPRLQWPGAYKIYNDMRRRTATLAAWMNAVRLLAMNSGPWLFKPASDARGDQLAAEFGNTVIEDMGGEWRQTVGDALNGLPFGWNVQEVVYGKRQRGWRDARGAEWQTRYNDGAIGWRAIEQRAQGTFFRWEFADEDGALLGMWQQDTPHPSVMIPIERMIHYTPIRDGSNPEGLCMLEPSYEPYYIRQNLLVVMGIGFERALIGFPVFETESTPTDGDNAKIKGAVSQMLASMEKSYLLMPPGVKMHLESVAGTNSVEILSAINYCDVLMLRTALADFMALGAGGDTGSYALGTDKSTLFIMAVNGVLNAYADTINAGAARRLFDLNRGRFPGMTYYPKLEPPVIHKPTELSVLAQFVNAIAAHIPLDGDDIVSIRSRSDGVLAPRKAEDLQPAPTTPTAQPQTAPSDAPVAAQAAQNNYPVKVNFNFKNGSIGPRYMEFIAKRAMLEMSTRTASRDYKGQLAAMIEDVYSGDMSPASFSQSMRTLIRGEAESVYLEGFKATGWKDPAPDDLEAADHEQISAWIDGQLEHVADFVRAVKDAREDEAQRADVERRVALWAGAFASLGFAGTASAGRNMMVTRKLGKADKHCKDCIALDGKRARMGTFASAGQIPGTVDNTTECGPGCTCYYVTDDGRRIL